MTKTDVANLALSKIGEPVIDDIEDTGDPLARRALLHYTPTLKEVLRAHFWDFAQGVAEVSRLAERVIIPNRLTTNFSGNHNDLTFTQLDTNPVAPTIQLSKAGGLGSTSISVADRAIGIVVAQNFGVVTLTAAQAKAAIDANSAASALVAVSFPDGNDGSGALAPNGESIDFGPTALAGGSVTGDVDAPLLTPGLLGWAAAYELPDDFVKLRRVMTSEGARVDDFERRRIDGRACLLAAEYDALFIEYVQLVDDPDVYDPLFLEAFTTLLASKMARAVTGSEAMEADLRQAYEMMALPAARTADSHDSQSAENRPIDDVVRGGLLRPRADFLSDLDN